jgi:carboxyl-terminal processing protease
MPIKRISLSAIKLLAIVLVALVITLGSFTAGFMVRGSSSQNAAGMAILPSLLSPAASNNAEPKGISLFWEAWDILNKQFYGKVPADQDRIYGAIRGMVASFGDQNTAFIDPTRAKIIEEDASGSFEGIGAAIQADEAGRLVIAEPYVGKPAARAGIKGGDIIAAIDGLSTEGMNIFEAISHIRGPKGTKVVLTIIRVGEAKALTFEIIREKIEIEVVHSELLKDKIGYVSLSEFSQGASTKIAQAVKDLKGKGATAVILDLRDDPGGLLSESIDVSSLFLKRDLPVVKEKMKGENEKVYYSRSNEDFSDLPMVVLVNGGSASASEIVAGALKENGRAILIGEQSFGKGSVQLPHTLSDGSELRVTIAEWLTPQGHQIHKVGITPDIVVERTQQDFEAKKDPQLDRAVEYLGQKIER